MPYMSATAQAYENHPVRIVAENVRQVYEAQQSSASAHKPFAATMFSTVVSRKSASSDATQRQALQPRNHRDMHAVGLRDLRQRLFTGIAALDGLFASRV